MCVADEMRDLVSDSRDPPPQPSPSRGEGALSRHTGNSESPRAIALSKKETPPPLRGGRNATALREGGDVRCR